MPAVPASPATSMATIDSNENRRMAVLLSMQRVGSYVPRHSRPAADVATPADGYGAVTVPQYAELPALVGGGAWCAAAGVRCAGAASATLPSCAPHNPGQGRQWFCAWDGCTGNPSRTHRCEEPAAVTS